jgi:MoaA/NifB/PqqE/SkfB family radical SAM enzyme
METGAGAFSFNNMRKKFRRAFIEITDACNLSCGFCAPVPTGMARGAFMSVAEFDSAAGQVKPLAEVVSLHVLGEPFMHPRFAEILAAGSRLGLKINLVTNGTLLDKFGPAVFGESCLRQISFSLRALAALPQARRLKTLGRLIEFARNKTTGLMISFRLRGEEGDLFVSEMREHLLKAFLAEKSRAYSGGRPERATSGGIKLGDGVFLNYGAMFEWPGSVPHFGRRPDKVRGCLGLRHHFAVLCSGEVVPCCADYAGHLSLGNIKTRPLAEILLSPAAAALRDSIAAKTPMPPYCATCGFE